MAVLSHARPMSIAWLDKRTVLGVLLAALAALIVLVMSRPAALAPVLVAGSDLPAGAPLSELDLDVRRVSSVVGLVEGDTVGELAEWTLLVPLLAGEPLVPSLLVPPQVQESPDAFVLSLDRAHAVGGRLATGDLVDVLVTFAGNFDVPPVTETVASGVYVLDVELGESGFDANRVDVLLAVNSDLAARMANAREAGTVDLVRVAP